MIEQTGATPAPFFLQYCHVILERLFDIMKEVNLIR